MTDPQPDPEATLARIADKVEPVAEYCRGRPIKIKPGRAIVLTPEILPDGSVATPILIPESADGGQAARVQGAQVSYLPAAKA